MQQRKKSLIKRIFISKSLSELTQLSLFCKERNLELIAESCIGFEAIPFQIREQYDVLFFGSIRAAQFFLETKSINAAIQIACIGETTAQKLKALGLHVSFIGEKAGNPSDVAQKFRIWLGDQRVCFPISNVSKESIISEIPKEQYEKLVVYKTIFKKIERLESDIAIFTSPSNFESYLASGNKVPSVVIAWGRSTKKAISENGFQVSYTLASATEAELIQVISQII